MKFTVAAALFAAVAQASYPAGNVTYTTEVVTAYTTYCPAATQVTYGGKTYTITEATTLTITDCPCTVSKPVYTTSAVACSTCTAPAVKSSSSAPAPVYPTTYANTTVAVSTTAAAGTGSYKTSATSAAPSATTSVVAAGAGKTAALSGAGLLAALGLVAAAL